MTLKWACPGCFGPLLSHMKDNLPGWGIASNSARSPEPLFPRTHVSPGGISGSACSMHGRPVTASSVGIVGPHPADPGLGCRIHVGLFGDPLAHRKASS